MTCGLPSTGSYCEEHKPTPWSTSKRRDRMGVSGGAWDTLRQRVLARDKGCCYLCDQLGADHVDHLIEVAEGGGSHPENLASCHRSPCHERKTRDPEWAGSRVERALVVLSADPTPRAPTPFGASVKKARRGAAGARLPRSDS